MAEIEGFERRRDSVQAALAASGLSTLQDANELLKAHNIDTAELVRKIQPICFENACWAYVLGGAIAVARGVTDAAEIAETIGEGLQAFCVPGSVADHRKIGIGHGSLAARLLSEKTRCFAFVAGHESFAAAEGAIGIANSANRVRKTRLQVILNGLGKDAGYIISRINGFTYVHTEWDHAKRELNILGEKRFTQGPRAEILCFGADEVEEGVAIMIHNQVDVSITGNATNMSRFQHPVTGTYKRWCIQNGRDFFAVASGGGTGRTVNPDENGAGPASYGLTDTVGRMYADAQFAGSSSVPAHVDMMGFVGMGNNPMVGATVSLAVAICQAAR
ncbi:GGGtGRT protein [Mameliella alba]|uniref:GGGtGRT protein n=1 Tax=Mameliella alba TaxID=561184 RepID=UPI001C96D33C|nr:GGGtGRT protein [Mameliella alba]MBY6122819.1 GGGtGRT protein [Mameliella alba]